MENKNIGNLIYEALLNYMKEKAEPYIEKGIRKLARVAGILFSAIVLLASLLMVLVFSGITAAIFLNEFLGKNYLGFLIVTGVYLLMGWFTWIMRKKIVSKIIEHIMLQEAKNL